MFGPYQRPEHTYSAVIPKWIWSAIQGKPINIEGDGTQSRDFTFVGDVVKVLIDSLEMNLGEENLINLAFGVQHNLNQVCDVIKLFFPELKINFTEARFGDIKHSLNYPAKLNRYFPKVAPHNFRVALKTTLDWLLQNQTEFNNSPSIRD